LIVGKIGVQPKAISGLQIRDVGDRQRLSVPGDLHFDARAEQIKIVAIGTNKRRSCDQTRQQAETAHRPLQEMIRPRNAGARKNPWKNHCR
jgi:hypothetical protein